MRLEDLVERAAARVADKRGVAAGRATQAEGEHDDEQDQEDEHPGDERGRDREVVQHEPVELIHGRRLQALFEALPIGPRRDRRL